MVIQSAFFSRGEIGVNVKAGGLVKWSREFRQNFTSGRGASVHEKAREKDAFNSRCKKFEMQILMGKKSRQEQQVHVLGDAEVNPGSERARGRASGIYQWPEWNKTRWRPARYAASRSKLTIKERNRSVRFPNSNDFFLCERVTSLLNHWIHILGSANRVKS